MKVNFFIAGTQKGGTTALHSMLAAVDGIEMSQPKELHFFDDELFDWKRPDYGPLHTHFDWSDKSAVRGEATPIYCYWRASLQRIRDYNADAKMIMLLRHPAYRAYSQWRMEFQRGNETLQFADAISKTGRSRVTESKGGVHRVYSYIERGFYSNQIRRLRDLFSNQQILIMRTDELWSKPQQAIDQVTRFLGIKASKIDSADYIVPKFPKKQPAPIFDELPKLIDQLTQLYTKDIDATEQLTGISLSDWLDPKYCEPMPYA